MSNPLTFIEIPADDVDRAAGFYQGLFGWSFLSTGAMHITESPGVGLRAAIRPRAVEGEAVVDYVTVDDIEERTRVATSLGASVVVPKTPVPTQGWFAQMTDTEGNVFGLWQDGEGA